MANWILTKENGRFTIRKSKGERYPREKYKNITSERDLEDLVIRLNGKDPAEERTRESVLFKHAFISPKLLDDYRVFLDSRIPTKKDAGTMFHYLTLSLKYFIIELELSNPLDWHKRQHVWGNHLLSTKYSSKVLKYMIYELNRFLEYLHQQRPGEVPPLKLDPVSKAALKKHDAERNPRKSMIIEPDHWELIKNHLVDDPILPILEICYLYGLRRNEVLGLEVKDVRMDILKIERQYGGGPLKNREPRKVPHWFSNPKQAYELIVRLPKIHPDTVSARFSEVVTELKLPKYVIHDLRRTFITNCVANKIEPEALRLAVGHSSIEVTYKYYVLDARRFGEVVYKPGA